MTRNRNSDALNAAFGGKPFEKPSWLFLQETRSFPELLNDWMHHEGTTDSATFLDRLHLTDAISPADLDALRNTTKTPSSSFINLCSVLLPLTAHVRTYAMAGISRYKLQRSADYWRTAHPDLPTVDIAPQFLENFRLQKLQRIQNEAPKVSFYKKPEFKLTKNHKSIYRALETIARDAGKDSEEIAEIFAQHYRRSPLTTLTTLHNLLAASNLHFTDDVLETFLVALSAPKEKEVAATCQALQFLRQSMGITQYDLAGKMGISQGLCSWWERFSTPPAESLGGILKALPTSAEEAECLALMVRPKIIANTGIEWLRETIARHDWLYLSYPSFDATWLNAQPPEKQAGLLLRDLRNHAGKSITELSNHLHIDQSAIRRWELGTRKINTDKLAGLLEAIVPSPLYAERLVMLARPDITARVETGWLHKQIETKNWNLFSFPALNEEWLAAQEPHKRGGLLLHDIRGYLGKNLPEMANDLKIDKTTLANWENAVTQIDISKIMHYRKTFSTVFRSDCFLSIFEASNTAHQEHAEAVRAERVQMRRINTSVGTAALLKSMPELAPKYSPQQTNYR